MCEFRSFQYATVNDGLTRHSPGPTTNAIERTTLDRPEAAAHLRKQQQSTVDH